MERPTTDVLYNETCPVCRFEIDSYRRLALRDGLALRFDGLAEAEAWGIGADAAARRLHVRQGGRIVSGMPAFRLLWAQMPGWRWLARVTGWPLVRPASTWVYDRVLAPLLYRAHLRRQRRS